MILKPSHIFPIRIHPTLFTITLLHYINHTHTRYTVKQCNTTICYVFWLIRTTTGHLYYRSSKNISRFCNTRSLRLLALTNICVFNKIRNTGHVCSLKLIQFLVVCKMSSRLYFNPNEYTGS
jgi:hypothetical protein